MDAKGYLNVNDLRKIWKEEFLPSIKCEILKSELEALRTSIKTLTACMCWQKSCLLTNQTWPCYMFYHWYYLRFYSSHSSLYCCQLFQHDGVQQESSCYFGHCTQMNLMSFSLYNYYLSATLFSDLRALM